MKKFFALLSLVVYISWSSYVAHGMMMNIFDNQKIQKEIVCEMHEEDVQYDDTKNSKETCFQKCLGQYWMLSSVQSLTIRDISTHTIPQFSMKLFSLEDSGVEYISLSHSPPWWTICVVHEGYVGQTTLLLI